MADSLPDSSPEILAKADKIVKDLDLEIDDLRGKKILDLGSNTSELARAAKHYGIDSITSLDKRPYVLSRRRDLKSVAANAKELPFKDESFDLIISHFAPPISFNKIEDVIELLEEIKRVLAERGEARMYPAFKPFIKNLEEKLAKNKKISDEEIVKAVKVSTKYFNNLGYNLNLKINKSKSRPYWILKK